MAFLARRNRITGRISRILRTLRCLSLGLGSRRASPYEPKAEPALVLTIRSDAISAGDSRLRAIFTINKLRNDGRCWSLSNTDSKARKCSMLPVKQPFGRALGDVNQI